MDFRLPPEIEDTRLKVRDFVAREILPLEADRANYDDNENIARPLLGEVRAKVKAAGLWALQMPRRRGGQGLGAVAMAACYEEMGRSIFGPVCFNCAAPDDGNMIVLDKVLGEEQKDRWLQPIIDGEVQSAFAMTEPMPGAGSDPAGMMLTQGREARQWLGRARPQVVHHRGRGGQAFHSRRPHLGRAAPRAQRLPLPCRPAGMGASSGAFRSWGPKTTAGTASWSSTGSRSRPRTCCSARATA